jgi:hypothetical protein
MAGDLGTFRCEPGETVHQTLSNALFDDALGFWQSIGRGDARYIETERVSLFFDGCRIQH